MDQYLAKGCHHSLCIKQNTCMIHGSKEVPLVQHTVYLPLDGWRVLTSLAGLTKNLKKVELLFRNCPVILFVNEHHSHINLELITVTREYKVNNMCLPPNLTHMLQPIDVGVFHPLKQCYYNILKEYRMQTMAENVTKNIFPSLIKQL